jgi:hypothetical protein
MNEHPCNTIPLTKGKFTTVDESDFELVNSFKWYAREYLNREVIKELEQRIKNTIEFKGASDHSLSMCDGFQEAIKLLKEGVGK